MAFDERQIEQIITLCNNAGSAIIEKYESTTAFKLKDDNTPITEADLLSHNILTEGLQKITPNINILSEEGGFIPFKERKTWQEYWLIDPLDGTRGFIDKTDDFCICLSYIQNNEVVFGLIYEPLTKVYYLANSPDKAYKIQNGDWQHIKTQKPGNTLKVLVGRYSINNKAVKQHLCGTLGARKYELFGVGSALKFCYIAEGKYDYYPALGVCSEWDTAAGSFILRAAGGHTIDFFDNNLKYNTKNDLISPMFFASGDFKLSRTD